ncbi:S1 family peptidase [Paenibacillus sp. CAU 1782]
MKKLVMSLMLIVLLLLHSTAFAQDETKNEIINQVESELPLSEKQQEQLEYEKQYLESIFTIVGEYFGDTEGFNQYGEIYIDNENDFKFVVAIAKTNDKVAAFVEEMKRIIPQDLLEVESVKYSKADLIQIQDNILNNLQNNYPNFSSLNAVISSSVKDQEVTVSINEQPIQTFHEEKGISLAALLLEYDEVLNIETGAPSEPAKLRTDEFTVLGGGIYVSLGCSTTGTATKDTREFLITAGHCITNTGASVSQGGTAIGTQHFSAYTNGGTDVGLILLTNKKKKISNEFYYGNVANAEYDKRYTTTSSVLTNQLLCKSGNTTGVTCGTVSSTSSSVTYGSISLSNLIQIYKETGGVIAGGDSGGIVFEAYTTTRIVGIVSGNSVKTDTYPAGTWGYVTKISPALTAAGNVTLYTSNTEKVVDPDN